MIYSKRHTTLIRAAYMGVLMLPVQGWVSEIFAQISQHISGKTSIQFNNNLNVGDSFKGF